jgi:hypothetical protein
VARHRPRSIRALSRLRLALAAVILAASAIAVAGWSTDGAGGRSQPPTPLAPLPGAASLPVQLAPGGASTVDTGADPRRVRIPSVGIDGAVLQMGVDAAGRLQPPEDTAVAGWFAQGTAPGAVGPAVIAGHVDSWRGPGVFFRLRAVVPGDPVLVERADGSTLRFTVTRVDRYAKAAFPTGEVYGPTPGPELRLITCGGAFDRSVRSYVDDVVVSARLSL